jgi:hypothetical protein
MPSDLTPLHDWAERVDPPYTVYRAVEDWILALDANPFQPPSRSWTLNEGEPYEVRVAELVDPAVVVFYTVEHEGLTIDLLGVVPDTPPS